MFITKLITVTSLIASVLMKKYSIPVVFILFFSEFPVNSRLVDNGKLQKMKYLNLKEFFLIFSSKYLSS